MANVKIPKVVRKTSGTLNKKGEIRGNNKRETKTLKKSCTHFIVNKKGKLKSPTDIIDGKCHCYACGADFRCKLYKKDEIKEICNDTIEMINHFKFLSVATGADEETVNFLVHLAVEFGKLPKVARKLTEMAEKQEKIKGNNKKNKYNNGGSESLGSWSTKR